MLGSPLYSPICLSTHWTAHQARLHCGEDPESSPGLCPDTLRWCPGACSLVGRHRGSQLEPSEEEEPRNRRPWPRGWGGGAPCMVRAEAPRVATLPGHVPAPHMELLLKSVHSATSTGGAEAQGG